jgi:hypothetical protein
MDPEKGQAGKMLYGAYKDAVEGAAENANPATAELFKKGKEAYGLFAPIQEAAERRAATTQQSPWGGLLDTATAIGGGAAGARADDSPMGAVAGVGAGLASIIARRKFAPRAASSFAVGADQIGNILKQAPQMFGKYAPVLLNAARRGGNALSASHYILQSTDPEYRKTVNGVTGGDNDSEASKN